jgi:asparagine synthase (glutamine-hydrolysing)
MLEAIQHRGPDGWGCYLSPDERAGLYHVRLSIVDIGGGRQPLSNEDGSVWITFNGEIYEHDAIRRELEARGHRFRTRSDTEVIVHLYEEYGEAFVDRLRGEFAFALYDERRDTLLLVRDRFGIKPLYYTIDDERLLFGSEIKALIAHGSLTPELDQESIFNALCSLPMASRTMFHGILQLEPGTLLKVCGSTSTLRRYWDLSFDQAAEENRDLTAAQEGALIEEFKHRFDEAVRIRLVADVPVGVYLSGGLDSSAVASSIREATNDRAKAFTIGFEDAAYDESAIAKQVAEHLNLDWHVIRVGGGDLAAQFLKSIWHAEIPVPMSNGTAKFLLSKLAREHVKVVLTGEGSDELLCGYPQFKHQRLLEELKKNPGDRSTQQRLEAFMTATAGQPYVVSARSLRETESVTGTFGNYPYPALRKWHFSKPIRFLQSRPAGRTTQGQDVLGLVARSMNPDRLKGIDPLSATQYFLFKTDLPHLLLNWLGDREEMAHSIEGRVPFLDHHLVEFGTRLPASLKLRGELEKYVLRRSMESRLPPVMKQVSKRMFLAPTLNTLNFFDNEAFQPLISRRRLEEAGVFSPNAVAFLKLMSRMSRKGSAKYKHYEGALTYVISVQILHEMFIRDFNTHSVRLRLGEIRDDWRRGLVARPHRSAAE